MPIWGISARGRSARRHVSGELDTFLDQELECTMSNFWGNRTIKAKLLLGIGAILALFALTSAIALALVNGLVSSADIALNHVYPMRALAFRTNFLLVHADDLLSYSISDRRSAKQAGYLSAYQTDIAEIRAFGGHFGQDIVGGAVDDADHFADRVTGERLL